MAFPYAVRTLIAEITQPPMALVDGKPRELEPMRAGPRVDFGEPIGEGETIFTLHSEVLTFGDSFGAKHVTFALSLSPEVLKLLGELAEASEERVAEAARSASPPSPNTISAHVVEATSGGGTLRIASVTPRKSPGDSAAASSPPGRWWLRPSGCWREEESPGPGRFPRSSASIPTRCSASSRPAASGSM